MGAEALFGVGALEDKVDNEVPDAWDMLAKVGDVGYTMHRLALTLVSRQDLPSRHDHIVEDLQTQD
jgi:hypothetical protein